MDRFVNAVQIVRMMWRWISLFKQEMGAQVEDFARHVWRFMQALRLNYNGDIIMWRHQLLGVLIQIKCSFSAE